MDEEWMKNGWRSTYTPCHTYLLTRNHWLVTATCPLSPVRGDLWTMKVFGNLSIRFKHRPWWCYVGASLTGSPPSTATSLLSSLDIVLAEGELNLFSASLARARLHFGLARREGEETLGAPDSCENVYQKRKTGSDSLSSRYDLCKVC